MPLLSIVMPVRNGGHLIAQQLDALEVAIGSRDDVEVIIADNGSTDGTAPIALSYRQRLRVRVVDAGRAAGINVARNEGVRGATGERLLICDADDEVDPGWVAGMTAAFDQGCQLLAGPIDYTMLNSETICGWRGAERATVYCALGFLPAGHGSNAGFTRAVFEAVGGFDESFRGGGDDTDFFWRAQLAGFQLHEVPDALVHYRLRPRLRDLFRQSLHYARAEAQLARKFQHAGLRRRSPKAALHDVWWLVSRAPFALVPHRRGAWVRRAAISIGRLRGAVEYRIMWW